MKILSRSHGFIKALLFAFAIFFFVFGQVFAIERVSLTSGGLQASGGSTIPSVSSDGRYVAFQSTASDIVSGDVNGVSDIFVYDRNTNSVQRVSISTAGIQGNAASASPSISADGRYVAFDSAATNLVVGDDEGLSDIFVHDRQMGTTERVSIDGLGEGGDNDSNLPDISSDGRYVSFISYAANLVGGDTNIVQDIFVFDRDADTMERVSVNSFGAEADNASGASFKPSISGDGRYVAFDSTATNLITGDANFNQDAFVHDRQTGSTELVSIDDTGLVQGNGVSIPTDISSDGRYVVVLSAADNLVGGDGNGVVDMFVYDRTTETIERVSVDDAGTEGDSDSDTGSISDDGRYVVFASIASNFSVDDGNSDNDVFVYDRTEDMVQILSVDDSGDEGDGASYRPVISNDGLFIAFMSNATDLVSGDTNGNFDIFINDVPHTPTDMTLSNNSIDENSSPGTLIGSLTTTDANVDDNHAYSFTCTVPGADDGSFQISGSNLQSAASFDFETDNSYSICIRTTDGYGETYDENFTITINNVNENTTGSGGGGPDEGCTDTSANNYDDDAEVDDGSCEYDPTVGCIDALALNFEPLATISGGVCIYPAIYYGCTDNSANNFDDDAVINDGSCEYDDPVGVTDISGCMDADATNYNPSATLADGSCSYIDIPIDTDPPSGPGPSNPSNPGSGGGSNGGSFNPPKEILDVIVPVGLAIPLLVTLIQNSGLVASALSIPIRIWTIIPTLMGYKRRKRPWGTVYDSVTKQPLDPVYVTLFGADKKEVTTSITDIDGRYGFFVPGGMYSMSANKANYKFPSEKMAGKTSDELYDSLYFGGDVEVKGKEEVINKNIPMDAIDFNWNEFEKGKNKQLMKFYSSLDLFFGRTAKILFVAGLLSSVFLSIFAPSVLNWVFLGIYGVIIILAFFGIKPRGSGHVFERSSGYPLSFGILRVFSAELNREVGHTVIGKTGKYFILVPKGKYYMKIQKKTGEDSYTDIYKSESFRARNGYIDKIIKI